MMSSGTSNDLPRSRYSTVFLDKNEMTHNHDIKVVDSGHFNFH